MKYRLIRYIGATCALVLILSMAMLLSDVGYVYIYMWQWQIQSSLLLLIILFLVLGLGVYILAQIGKRLQQKKIQKNKHIQYFEQLYRYEQTGILYLLQTQYGHCEHQFKMMRDIYQTSPFLKPLIKAHIAYQHQHYDKAMQRLKWVVPSCFELKEIQLVQIYLAQQNVEKSLAHLLVLEHPKQAWLEQVDDIYQKKIDQLWAEFAGLFPIAYIQQQHHNKFSEQEWQKFSQALYEKRHVLQEIQSQHLEILHPYLHQYRQQVGDLWYVILQMLDAQQAQNYVQQMDYFSEKLFIEWFYQQMQQHHYQAIQIQLDSWKEKYPSIPLLQSAQILVYLAQQQYASAQQILVLPSEYDFIQYLQNNGQSLEQIKVDQLLKLFYQMVKSA